MKHGNLSTWNSAFGDTAYTEDNPYAIGPMPAGGVDYRGSAVKTANFSFQEGYADPYGNIFQRIFTPRKWESKRGLTEGDASLFSRGSADRQDYFAERRTKRGTAKAERQQKRASKQYRVVRGQGGYIYKERGDGSIEIVKSPSGASGKILRPGDKGYSAIKSEISRTHGQFGQKPSAADWMRVGGAGAGAAVDIISALRRTTPESGGAYQTGAPAPAGMPPWLLPVGAGLVGVIIIASVLKR
jgi:hypothetical protein